MCQIVSGGVVLVTSKTSAVLLLDAHSSNSTFPLVSSSELPPKKENTGERLFTHSMVAVFADSSS